MCIIEKQILVKVLKVIKLTHIKTLCSWQIMLIFG